MVECLNRDRGFVGSSLNGGTACVVFKQNFDENGDDDDSECLKEHMSKSDCSIVIIRSQNIVSCSHLK